MALCSHCMQCCPFHNSGIGLRKLINAAPYVQTLNLQKLQLCVAGQVLAEASEAAKEKVRLGFQVYRPPPQLGQPSSLELVRTRTHT